KKMVERLAASSDSSFPSCFKTRAELIGAYRLFNNEFVTPEKILKPHLKEEERIDWLHHPFSRCLGCNSPLEKTTDTSLVPLQMQENVKEFWSCPTCHHIFWLGSHTEHMLAILTAWQKTA
ncbi:MAG TPA: Mut7-C RNAse domain-containing protein, partial [Rhabdochlamydiaceae bacterium]